jgi:hypothetical protein
MNDLSGFRAYAVLDILPLNVFSIKKVFMELILIRVKARNA